MNSLRHMVRFMRPYRTVVIIGFVTVVLPVLMELIVPRTLQYIIDQGINAGDMQKISYASIVMLVAALIGAGAALGQGICRAKLSQGMAYDMRTELFAHIQSLSFANLDRMQTGKLMTRMSSDVDVVRMFSSAGLSLLIRALLMIVGSLVMLMIIDFQLSMIMLLLMCLSGLIIGSVTRKARPLFMAIQRKLSALNTLIQENLAGVSVVKAYAREPYEIERFEEGNYEYMVQNVEVGRLMALVLPTLLVLTNLGMVATIWFGGNDVITGRLSLGELVAFNNYLMIGMAPLLMLGNILMMVSRADASADRVLETLAVQPAVQPAPVARTSDNGAGRVVFNNVSFHYEGTEGDDGPGHEAVLNGLDVAVESGQRVALLGATGTGKSTLVNLVPRFYDVTGGSITVDDIDVRDWSSDVLRSRIGMVLQQTTLFSGTIYENIAYGRPDAPLEDVVAAAKVAQAHDFIMRMPDGYDSAVEARGANFSGGQKQRLAIARALLVEPSILIMDDCTSAVDLDTEAKIQEALEKSMNGRTTFIVAQRINSVLTADQILILDKGRIRARGTHRELLISSPLYREIYESQIGESSATGSDQLL